MNQKTKDMDIIKVLKLILENPANNLTTTTVDLIKTSIVSVELDKEQEPTEEEKSGILDLINYVIDKRVSDKATDLSYTELLNLKNKLQK